MGDPIGVFLDWVDTAYSVCVADIAYSETMVSHVSGYCFDPRLMGALWFFGDVVG